MLVVDSQKYRKNQCSEIVSHSIANIEADAALSE